MIVRRDALIEEWNGLIISNDLFFMGDLKIFAKSEREVNGLLSTL